MSVKSGLFAALCSAAFLLASCSPKAGESVVLEVGSSRVTLSEYEQFYLKNSTPEEVPGTIPMEERERFLGLLTKYKLKLMDAADKGLMQDPEVRSELREYRTSLATTYILEKQITEPGIRRLYDRKTEEIRARHILVKLTPEMKPGDTLLAHNKAMRLIGLLNSGADFDSLAAAESDDPTASVNRGDLYFFTGGQMVLPFEDAAYSMKVGEISRKPVRTSFGYHILKIDARQPVRGAIKVRHIMALAKKSPTDTADTAAALAKVQAWQDSLAKGADFVELAKAVSEDVGSAPRGGELGWFERKRYVQPFDEACFLLNPGEVSPIVRTPYGYHLIMMDSLKPMATYAELRALPGDPLKKQYQQIRFSDDYNNFIDSLRTKFRYSFNEGNFAALLAAVDSNQTTEDSAWDANVTNSIRALSLMEVGGRVYSVDSIMTMMLNRQELQNTLLRRTDLDRQFRRISEGLLLEAEGAGLEQRSPEFASLMKDYTDGIVLYRAEQLEVWNRTAVTDSGLRAYWEGHKADFTFPPNVTFAELNFETDTLALMIYDSLMRGADFAALAAVHNFDDSLRTNGGVSGPFPANLDDITAYVSNMTVGQISEPVPVEGGYAILKLIAMEPARQKTFDEAGAELSNAYQDYESKRLENQWLDRIRQKHPVKQYPELLQKAFMSVPAAAAPDPNK